MRVMLYAPESLVSPTYRVPRSVSVAVTFAPLIGAPLGSVTVPTMAAVTSWLQAGCRTLSTPTSTTPILINFFIADPPKDSFINRTYCGSAIRLGQCYIVVSSRSSRRKYRNSEFFYFAAPSVPIYSTCRWTSVMGQGACGKADRAVSGNLDVYHQNTL